MNKKQPTLTDRQATAAERVGMIYLFKLAIGCARDPDALELAQRAPWALIAVRWDEWNYLVRREMCRILGLPQHTEKTFWYYFTPAEQDEIAVRVQSRAARIAVLEAEGIVVAMDGKSQPAWGVAA